MTPDEIRKIAEKAVREWCADHPRVTWVEAVVESFTPAVEAAIREACVRTLEEAAKAVESVWDQGREGVHGGEQTNPNRSRNPRPRRRAEGGLRWLTS